MRRELRLLAALLALALLAGALSGRAAARDDRQERLVARHWLLGGLLPAVLAQERATDGLLDRPGVVGTAVSRTADGRPALVILRGADQVDGLPEAVEGVPTVIRTIGRPRTFAPDRATLRQEEDDEAGDDEDAGDAEPPRFTAEQHRYPRPVPIGASVGNAGECTAGSIGARVTDGRQIYLLSNNHVLARENRAPIGSDVVHPGPADTACETGPGDVLGDLTRIEPVAVGPDPLDPETAAEPALPVVPDGTEPAPAENLIDAALALTTPSDLSNATPPDGYGLPLEETITAEAALGQAVQKYGRTTGLTRGRVVAINGVLEVAYAGGLARFVDQLIVVSPAPFLASGDSGALLVTDPGRHPAGLLFASNSAGTVALANEIDHVLDAFGVTIDGEPSGFESAWSQPPLAARDAGRLAANR